MNIFSKAGCRIFQKIFHIAIPLLPYRNPKIRESIGEISEILNENRCKAPMLFTDKNLIGYAKEISEILERENIKCIIYEDILPNPTVRMVESAVRIYKENNCDSIIALGGGSPMDCAKGVGARIARPKTSLRQMAGILKVIKKTPLIIAIPTTAGTGSETTVTVLVTDEKTKHKYMVSDFPLIPSYAILDAGLLKSLPAHLVATTGMDALTHAVEAYIGNSTTKETRAYCMDAVKLIFENIYNAYKGDEESRQRMLYASHYAGRAFTRSYVGYIHAVSHSLSGEYNMAHGLTNAVILPHVLEKYGSKIYKKLSELSFAAGIGNLHASHKENAGNFISAIRKMNSEMGIPEKLKGINTAHISKLARYAAKEANPLYPVPVIMGAEELEEIYYGIME